MLHRSRQFFLRDNYRYLLSAIILLITLATIYTSKATTVYSIPASASKALKAESDKDRVDLTGRVDLLAQTAALINLLQLNRIINNDDYQPTDLRNFSIDFFSYADFNKTTYTNIENLSSTNNFILFGMSFNKQYKNWLFTFTPFAEMGHNHIKHDSTNEQLSQQVEQAHILGGAQIKAIFNYGPTNWLGAAASLNTGTIVREDDLKYLTGKDILYSGPDKALAPNHKPINPTPIPLHLNGFGLNIGLFYGHKLANNSSIKFTGFYNQNSISIIKHTDQKIDNISPQTSSKSINLAAKYNYNLILENKGLLSPYIEGAIEYIFAGNATGALEPSTSNLPNTKQANLNKLPTNFDLSGLNYHMKIGLLLQPTSNKDWKINSNLQFGIGAVKTIAAHLELLYKY